MYTVKLWLHVYVHDVTVKHPNLEHNRLKKEELPERK